MAKKKTTFNIDKNSHFSKWYSEVLQKAEISDIRYGVKGFLVIRPWGARIIEKMYNLYESALQRTGHEPSFFPCVIPEENFKKESGHVEGFTPQVFWLENKQGEEKIALRPTSETAFNQMYNLWIRSYRDLPLKIYQRANVFRYETKATRPLIRSREFWWIESHNCFATKKQAEQQVQEDITTTEKVMFELFGVPFLALKRPEWDKFPGAVHTIGSDSIMPDGRIIQQPSTHLLGQNFSKVFNVKFIDKNEKEDFVWQTCYGPAISRILASVISIHGDNSGLVLPYVLSPYQIIIIPMHSEKKSKEIKDLAEKLKKEFFNSQINSKIDDTNQRPGEKFFFWEMKGIPFRIEIGEKELEKKELTIFIRDIKQKTKIKTDNIITEIKKLGKEYDDRLKEKSKDFFIKRIIDCKSKQDVKKVLNETKIARFNFCSIESDGEKCAEIIEKEFEGEIRGIKFDKTEKPTGNCVFCNKKAKVIAYAGKSY